MFQKLGFLSLVLVDSSLSILLLMLLNFIFSLWLVTIFSFLKKIYEVAIITAFHSLCLTFIYLSQYSFIILDLGYCFPYHLDVAIYWHFELFIVGCILLHINFFSFFFLVWLSFKIVGCFIFNFGSLWQLLLKNIHGLHWLLFRELFFSHFSLLGPISIFKVLHSSFPLFC